MVKVYRNVAKKAILMVASLATVFSTPVSVLARTPNDPRLADQQMMWSQINAPTAWDITTGSKQVIVAIIDTGFDSWHDDLSPNVWVNKKEIPDNDIDDDRNGYIDDIHGWNFVENNNNPRTSVFEAGDDPESVRHGTIIAGLIGARGDNGRDGTGLNWNVQMMPLRAINSRGSGAISNVIKAVDYAVAEGADVISMSFVSEVGDTLLKETLYQAYKKGIVIVAAAGNHTSDVSGLTNTFPACYDKGSAENWIVAVGSVDSRDMVSDFSNTHSCIDIMAPGDGLFSTERYAPQYGYHNSFGGPWRGTSFAAPLIAGAASLLKARRPDWTAPTIISTLISTADSITGVNPGFTTGRLNVGRALETADSASSPEPEGTLYTFSGNQVFSRDVVTGATSTFAYISGSRILSLSADPFDKTVALLVQRDKTYYVRVLRPDGGLESEYSLPFAPSANERLLGIRQVAINQYPGAVMVGRYNTKSKKSTFALYDTKGVERKGYVVNDNVTAWSTGIQSPVVVFARITKNKGLLLEQFNMFDDKVASHTIPNVRAFVTMTMAPLQGDGGEQVVLLFERGKETMQAIVDVSLKTTRFDSLGAVSAKKVWRLLVVRGAHGQLGFVPYTSLGGRFGVRDSRNAEQGKVTLPVSR
jgi:subtilisin family serine protease